MFYGVLTMPYELAMHSEMTRTQFYGRAQEAIERLQELEKKNAWQPMETAPRDGEGILMLGEHDHEGVVASVVHYDGKHGGYERWLGFSSHVKPLCWKPIDVPEEYLI